MKIKKSDKVQILRGKDRVKKNKKGEKGGKGNQGKVIEVIPSREMVVVEGLNMRFKHVRPRREGEKGQRIEFPAPLHVSKVILICPRCSQTTRVGYQLLNSKEKGKKKIRICKKCKQAID